jgi:hypothetical protein
VLVLFQGFKYDEVPNGRTLTQKQKTKNKKLKLKLSSI